VTAHVPAVAVAAGDGARAGMLLRCLHALASGALLPQRVLVVDQSTGREVAAILDLLEGPLVVEYLAQPRLGLSASRNAALDRLDEQIVAITDEDCVPDAQWLAAIAKAFDDDPELAAVTGPVLPLAAEGERVAAVSTRSGTEKRIFAGRISPWHVGTGGNMALNRARVGAVRFDTRLGVGTAGGAGEDLDLIDRVLTAGERILFEPRALVLHERQTPERRVSTRYSYGRGVGAMIGLRLRRRDAGGLRQLAGWLALRLRLAIRRRSPREELRVLAGTATGLVYGVRAR
jgi:GT2 family glycosyltransferase